MNAKKDVLNKHCNTFRASSILKIHIQGGGAVDLSKLDFIDLHQTLHQPRNQSSVSLRCDALTKPNGGGVDQETKQSGSGGPHFLSEIERLLKREL